MQINTLKELLDELKVPIPSHKIAVPAAPARTPRPERNKVVAIPTRTAINRQAALVISPANCWLSKPLPPEKPPNPYLEELNEVKAELKIERNNHALTRDDLGAARQTIRELRQSLDRQTQLLQKLETKIREQKETIRQLEDLKL